MTPRKPTPAEVKLWRESNRFTQKKDSEFGIEDLEEDEAAESASPRRGEVGRGAESYSVRARNAPTPSNDSPDHLNPLRGREPLPLTPLSIREAKRVFSAHPAVGATLDLHGLHKLAAYEQVQQFIARQQRAGRRHVLIITGKGRGGEGVLRSSLPHWLNGAALRPLISAFTYGRPENGGAGVMHVLLKAYP